MSQTQMIFSNGTDAASWYVINDGVMGGVSESTIVQMENAVRFQGVVRLENNGGFASMRKRVKAVDEEFVDPAVHLSVRGDGQTYECRFRMAGNRLSYVHPFSTKAGEITSVKLLVEDFQPSFRGRKYRVEEVGHLDLSRLQELGILIADKQRGPFQIDVMSIRVQSE